jgi:hypothetical protein
LEEKAAPIYPCEILGSVSTKNQHEKIVVFPPQGELEIVGEIDLRREEE